MYANNVICTGNTLYRKYEKIIDECCTGNTVTCTGTCDQVFHIALLYYKFYRMFS